MDHSAGGMGIQFIHCCILCEKKKLMDRLLGDTHISVYVSCISDT